MKKLLAAAVALLILVGCADTSADDKWETKIEDAVKIAQKENKNILVNFTGSDWCVWCKKLNKEVFTQEEFENYADENLVLVKIDFPKKTKLPEEVMKYNYSVARKYQVPGYPTIILLDKNGELVGRTGYQAGGAEPYIAHLNEFFKG